MALIAHACPSMEAATDMEFDLDPDVLDEALAPMAESAAASSAGGGIDLDEGAASEDDPFADVVAPAGDDDLEGVCTCPASFLFNRGVLGLHCCMGLRVHARPVGTGGRRGQYL